MNPAPSLTREEIECSKTEAAQCIYGGFHYCSLSAPVVHDLCAMALRSLDADAQIEAHRTGHQKTKDVYEAAFVDIRRALGLFEEVEHEHVIDTIAALRKERDELLNRNDACEHALDGANRDRTVDQGRAADARRDHVHCMKRADALRAERDALRSRLEAAERFVNELREEAKKSADKVPFDPDTSNYDDMERLGFDRGIICYASSLVEQIAAYDAAPTSKEHATAAGESPAAVTAAPHASNVANPIVADADARGATQAVAGGTSFPAPSAARLSARQRASPLMDALPFRAFDSTSDYDEFKDKLAAEITAAENAARRALLEEVIVSVRSIFEARPTNYVREPTMDLLRSMLATLEAQGKRGAT